MPELPEVETIARTLGPQIEGRIIGAVQVLLPKSLEAGAELLPAVQGAMVAKVYRRAKLLLVGLNPAGQALPDTPDQPTAQWSEKCVPPAFGQQKNTFFPLTLAFHLKMTGRFFVHPNGTPTLPHTRIIFDLEKPDATQGEPDGRLFFDDIRTFGYCRILRPTDFASWPFWQKLGPEPLGTPAAELARRLQAKRTIIKGALLDQTVLAGIGNIYADEALFRARIAPDTKSSELSLKRLITLAEAVQDVLTISIRECGSSIRDYRDAHGNAGAFQNNFFVYGRKGENCKVCNTPLHTTTAAGRTTTFCPHCQRG